MALYAARWAAKNVVAAGIAERCEIRGGGHCWGFAVPETDRQRRETAEKARQFRDNLLEVLLSITLTGSLFMAAHGYVPAFAGS